MDEEYSILKLDVKSITIIHVVDHKHVSLFSSVKIHWLCLHYGADMLNRITLAISYTSAAIPYLKCTHILFWWYLYVVLFFIEHIIQQNVTAF